MSDRCEWCKRRKAETHGWCKRCWGNLWGRGLKWPEGYARKEKV